VLAGAAAALAAPAFVRAQPDWPRRPIRLVVPFAPVTLLARVPKPYVAHPDVPASDRRAFLALVRSRPGQLNQGSAGNGSAGHL
jgi:tripartite-type tricarboxylate transporter receptor subunit TctC